MEFIRNIIIFDAQIESARTLKNRLCEASKKLNVYVVTDRLQFTEITSKLALKAVFINGNVGKKDLFYILRFFSTFATNDTNTPLLLTSDDFSLIQDVLKTFALEELVVLPSPVSSEEIVEKLLISCLGKVEKQRPKGSLKVDKEFINIFVISTQKVITEMGQGAKIKALRPTMLSKLERPLENGISSKIVISNDFFKGTFFVVFPTETFLAFYEKVLMEKQQSINSTNQDFASELANIIYGQAKKTFSELGYNLEMAIPSIFKGEITHSPVYIIPFESDFGPFSLAIAPGLI